MIVHGKANRTPQPWPWGAQRLPPLPHRVGRSGTQALDAGEMMAGSKPASSSCARSHPWGPGVSPHLTSPSQSQPESKGKEK